MQPLFVSNIVLLKTNVNKHLYTIQGLVVPLHLYSVYMKFTVHINTKKVINMAHWA